tara:strand:+ start:390 stop:599 length:210 start_codon:yes stop_codon:yes gene_type:complete
MNSITVLTHRARKLLYLTRGLEENERQYIQNLLKLKELRFFIQLRYGGNLNKYNNMTKTKLIDELKYKR